MDPDVELVAALKAGPRQFERVRSARLAQNRGLQLNGADLTGIRRRGVDLSSAIMQDADLSGSDLSGANLDNANLSGAVLGEANLSGASLDEANLAGALLRGADLTRANLVRANLSRADLHRANLAEANLTEANLSDADLHGARLAGANLTRALMERSDLDTSDISDSNFFEARMNEVSMSEIIGATGASNLETTSVHRDARYFEHCRRGFWERRCDWEALRNMGKLPLFGISYTSLLLIPLLLYLLALYNSKVKVVAHWANLAHEKARTLPGDPLREFVKVVRAKLRPEPIPSLSFILLISTLLLAVASTIFILFCPSRIKEFTRDVWCDQLGRSLLHYWPLSWRHRPLRIICGICYLLGGLGALWVIVVKVVKAGHFIWFNSHFSLW